MSNINWFPGHMKKTADLIRENLKLVDLVVELIDARVPISSINPTLRQLTKDKARIIAIGKSDLASVHGVKEFIENCPDKTAVVNAVTGEGIKELKSIIKAQTKFVSDKMKSQGRKMRAIRVMVVGIPNVGKSTLINRLAGKAVAKTGNKPGVTRGKQWIRIDQNVELFDTPGILWPKFEDQETAAKLALVGSIKDEILSIDELALKLLEFTSNNSGWGFLKERYGIESDLYESVGQNHEIIYLIGKKRGALVKGGEVDYEKAARYLIDDFRQGRLGRISLD